MKRNRLSALLAASAAASLLFTIAPAGAQEEPALDVTPTRGPVGTTIHVAGDHCDEPVLALTMPSDEGELDLVGGQPDVDTVAHKWTAELVVPNEGDGRPLAPGDVLTVTADCLSDGTLAFEYPLVEFLVTGDDPPTTPTTAPPSPTTPRPPTPIVDVPPFTG